MDFWARGAFHRARKIVRGPRPKGRISGVGFDGVRRKPRKRKGSSTPTSNPGSNVEYVIVEVPPEPWVVSATPGRTKRCGLSRRSK